jgi:hypothetical protein
LRARRIAANVAAEGYHLLDDRIAQTGAFKDLTEDEKLSGLARNDGMGLWDKFRTTP